MYQLYLQNVQRVWRASVKMYSTAVCLSPDDLAVKVSQCWLDDLKSIPGKDDGIPVFPIRSIISLRQIEHPTREYNCSFIIATGGETATHLRLCEDTEVSVHLGLLSAQTCRPHRQRPICDEQSGQPSIHILCLVEPRMEQIAELSTTKGSCCTLLTIWRLYVHCTTNKQTNTHTSHVFRNFVQNINGVSARVTRVYCNSPLLCCEKQIRTWTPKESTDRKNNQQS